MLQVHGELFTRFLQAFGHGLHDAAVGLVQYVPGNSFFVNTIFFQYFFDNLRNPPDLFEMVMALEEEFDMEIPSEDLEQLETVQDVITYIENHK